MGELLVRGPSLLDRYAGTTASPLQDGWLRTGDVGRLKEGELFVAGRLDDFLVVAGRNLSATEIESVTEEHPMVRSGNSAVFPDEDGRYAVAVELVEELDPSGYREVAEGIRLLLAKRFLAPSSVWFVTRGSLPKTPSGKVQRHKVSSGIDAGLIPVVGQTSFRSVSMATALNPLIGYDKAAKIAKASQKEGKTVREIAYRDSGLPKDVVDKALDPKKQTVPSAERVAPGGG